jgi:ribosome-associated translation inhibitor RaiA
MKLTELELATIVNGRTKLDGIRAGIAIKFRRKGIEIDDVGDPIYNAINSAIASLEEVIEQHYLLTDHENLKL